MGCNDRLVIPKFTKEEIEGAVRDHRLLTMEIEFNTECNFNCIYCYASNEPAKNPLSGEEFRQVIVEAVALGVRTMVILGGEPTLYPHLLNKIRFMREQGLRVELFTNGARMTPELADELFALDVTVVLKMNTFERKVQDLMSGVKNAYDQIHSAFDNLKAAGYPTKEKTLGISTVICQHNFDELEGFWRWIREQGMTPYFEMITPQGRAKERDNLYVESEKVYELFVKLSAIDREFGFEWDPRPPLVGQECQRHQYSCVVTATGDVFPCVGVNLPVGNVRKTSLGEIIASSSVVQELRNYREHIKGPCSECDDLHQCYGCRGAAYQLTGDYLASDPLCWKINNGDRKAAADAGGCAGCVSDEAAQSAQSDQPGLPTSELDEFMPHRPPMRLVDRLIEVDDVSVAEVSIRDDMLFVSPDGTLDEAAYLEIIAQAMAARNGYANYGSGQSNKGFLVGAKNLVVNETARVGDTLTVRINKVAQLGEELVVIRGIVLRDATVMAEGEIKLYQDLGEKAA